MIENPIIYFLNTQGVLIFILFTLSIEWFVLKNKEVSKHTILSVITAFIITLVLKELFSMPRPFSSPLVVSSAGLATYSSFPSTHAALAFSTATTVALHQRKFGVFLLIIAALIAVGRVAANVHFPMDITVGILIGVLIGVFFDYMHFGKIKQKRRFDN